MRGLRYFTLRCKTRLRRLQADRSGISAVEFALILPIIIVLIAASEDFGQALMVDRRMSQISSTTTDLTAQQGSWTTSNLDAILSGTSTIIQPFPNGSLTIVVAALNVDASLNTTVAWSRGYNASSWAVGSKPPITVSKTILQSGVQMIVAQATYSLTTPFASLLKPVTGLSSYTYSRTGINRPRVSNTITLTGS
ncbi:Flp pilus assembly protein TadG [Rhizobium aquaticum]|uniref:Flp pilus assembly protein TadG n=1 Tax=Rhizobium aquaticum TaxID=1549636 RepID=A0ABV2IXJ1_9HYPH